MQLIGHELVEFEPLFWTQSTNEMSKDRLNLFEFDKDLIKFAKQRQMNFATVCIDTKQAIIANACGAKFILCHKLIAKNLSDLAQFYLFDAKIACVITHEHELEELAKFGVDVAIFQKGVVGGNF
ncbi:hypothetical protein [Campylobacter sp. 7477a]|uniref:hypothetical protein n=1 Tax=Campylobacter sp. 7477a TaxID=2735741 RepID=UPI003014E183|nr:hypothetical protein [Campylobacter sp. 7477a]